MAWSEPRFLTKQTASAIKHLALLNLPGTNTNVTAWENWWQYTHIRIILNLISTDELYMIYQILTYVVIILSSLSCENTWTHNVIDPFQVPSYLHWTRAWQWNCQVTNSNTIIEVLNFILHNCANHFTHHLFLQYMFFVLCTQFSSNTPSKYIPCYFTIIHFNILF